MRYEPYRTAMRKSTKSAVLIAEMINIESLILFLDALSLKEA